MLVDEADRLVSVSCFELTAPILGGVLWDDYFYLIGLKERLRFVDGGNEGDAVN